MKTGWLIMAMIGIMVILSTGSCKKDPVNQPPVPFFSITPDSGDTETLFALDATGSHDPEDPDSVLEYRWDYDDDGIYDWLFVRTLVNIHKYSAPGLYTVRLQVRDSEGATASVTRQLQVGQGNAYPLTPFAPNPGDSSNNILFGGRLSWVALDPDDDHLTFDLYLGSGQDPPLIEKDLPADQYFPSGLVPGLQYFWKVVSRDPGGLTATSPVWRFSIHSGIYIRDTLTDPRDGQKYPVIYLNQTWWMARNLNYDRPGRSLCYDNDPVNCDQYGRLYTYSSGDTVTCPPGWRIPGEQDWYLLEQSLGMIRYPNIPSGWMGNDQAYQMMEGGTSGLDLQFSGYADWDRNCYFLNEKAFFAPGYYGRMMIRNYGKIYIDSWRSDTFREVEYTAVRCIK